MRLLSIDPGNERSAWMIYDTERASPISYDHSINATVLELLTVSGIDHIAIEMIASYGMPVGREVFETCLWIGRFIQASPCGHSLIYRAQVKTHLCKSQKANDSNVRQALIDMFGPGKERAIGLKKTPGPLYGVSGDVWSALAVAVTWTGLHQQIARTA